MKDNPKLKRKIQSANRLPKKKKKPTLEEMPEMVEFKEKVKEGKLSKEENVEYLRKMMDVVGKGTK